MSYSITNKPYGPSVITVVGAGTHTIPLASLGTGDETISSANIKRIHWSTNNNISITRNSVKVLALHNNGIMNFDELGHSVANNNTGNIVVTINGAGSLTMQMTKVVGEAPETEFTFTEVVDTGGATITETNVGPLTIEARSTSFQVDPHVDGYIKINGTTVKTTTEGSRGHTLAVISPAGATVGSITTYDTFESSPGDGGAAGRAALTTALNAVTSGNYIVMITWDACSLDSTLRTTLNTGYGTTLSTTWASTRYSHIVIAKKI